MRESDQIHTYIKENIKTLHELKNKLFRVPMCNHYTYEL